jgi:hypothetical protein
MGCGGWAWGWEGCAEVFRVAVAAGLGLPAHSDMMQYVDLAILVASRENDTERSEVSFLDKRVFSGIPFAQGSGHGYYPVFFTEGTK